MPSTSAKERAKRFQELITALESFPADNFKPFDIHRTHYESAGLHIGVDVMVPKTGPTSAVRPVIVRIHGGFLITGSSLFPAWFSKWILQYAITHGAVIVSPNYRLLPEARGKDIMDDFREFWRWFASGGPQQHLNSLGRSDIVLESNGYLLIGESAGGYLAIQSVLLGYTRPKALIALYPMLDLGSDYYNRPFEKPIVGVPNYPNATVSNFLSSMSRTTVVTEAEPPSRLDLALAVVQNGRLVEILGDDPSLFPIERLGALGSSGERLLPPLCIFHGREDSAVPIQGTLKFVEALKRADPDAVVNLVVRGGDHGFDAYATPNDLWLREALAYVTKEWLHGAPSKI